MERRGNTYEEFAKIISAEGNYSPEKILLLEVAANRMFEDLDWEQSESLEWDDEAFERGRKRGKEIDWDFPDPPNCSWYDV